MIMKAVWASLVPLLLLAPMAYGAEEDYQRPWCAQHGATGTMRDIEYILPDRTRVDCMTRTHAVEFDFGHKWAEAIGQSLHYSRMTGLRPGIALIVLNSADERGLNRIRAVIDEFKLPIDVWVVP